MQMSVCAVALLLVYLPMRNSLSWSYMYTTSCRSRNLTTAPGYIASPNYPANYPPSVDCTTEIQAPYYTSIVITFTAFSLDPSCCCDYVDLIDKWPRYNLRFCGNQPMPTGPITLNGGKYIKVVFHSDNSSQFPGFRAEYIFQSYDHSKDCYIKNKDDSYTGTLNMTRSGLVCQRWDNQHPHDHAFTPTDFPANGYTTNYCRVLDEFQPWCYTIQQTPRWETCGVPECGTTKKTTTITATPSTEPTTKPTQPSTATNPPPAQRVESARNPKQTQPSLEQTNSSQQTYNPNSEASYTHLGAILGGTVVMLVGVVVGVCVLVRRRRLHSGNLKYADGFVDGEETTEEAVNPAKVLYKVTIDGSEIIRN